MSHAKVGPGSLKTVVVHQEQRNTHTHTDLLKRYNVILFPRIPQTGAFCGCITRLL